MVGFANGPTARSAVRGKSTRPNGSRWQPMAGLEPKTVTGAPPAPCLFARVSFQLSFFNFPPPTGADSAVTAT